MEEWRVKILDKLLNEKMPLDKGLAICRALVDIDMLAAINQGLIVRKPKEVKQKIKETILIRPNGVKQKFYPHSFKDNISWELENNFGWYGYSDGRYFQYRPGVDINFRILEIDKEQYDNQFIVKDVWGKIICNKYN